MLTMTVNLYAFQEQQHLKLFLMETKKYTTFTDGVWKRWKANDNDDDGGRLLSSCVLLVF